MENVNVMTAVSDTAVENTKPKHKWLAKGSRFAKKAILAAFLNHRLSRIEKMQLHRQVFLRC